MKQVQPSTKADAFQCPHCQAFARQRWYWMIAQQASGGPHTPARISSGGGSGLPAAIVPSNSAELTAALEAAKIRVSVEDGKQSSSGKTLSNVFLSRCDHCDQLGLWVRDKLVWPKSYSAPPPSEDMPDALVVDYREAAGIAAQSPRGAAALLRLLIQKLCDHLLGQQGGNLNQAIQKLVDQGLAPEVQAALDIVRVIGNEAVHPGQIDLTDDPETSSQLFNLVNLIVAQTIGRQKQIDAMMEKLPTGARAAIENRGSGKKA